MNGLSLFSGMAIGELALKHIISNYRTVGYVEWNKYCQDTIRVRIRDGVIDDAPLFGDIREFNARFASLYTGKVDWLSAGFPCQPFSVAGRQLGEGDERNQWPATRDSISIIRPRYCLLENVPGLLAHKYIRTIFGDLAEIGYDCEWDVVSAASVGAPHQRKRLWILAHSISTDSRRGSVVGRTHHKTRRISSTGKESIQPEDGKPCPNNPEPSRQDVSDAECLRQLQSEGGQQNERGRVSDSGKEMPDSIGERLERIKQTGTETRTTNRPGDGCDPGWWSVEPNVGRVVDGMAKRVDRLKALGNGWVPQVVKAILDVRTKDSL